MSDQEQTFIEESDPRGEPDCGPMRRLKAFLEPRLIGQATTPAIDERLAPHSRQVRDFRNVQARFNPEVSEDNPPPAQAPPAPPNGPQDTGELLQSPDSNNGLLPASWYPIGPSALRRPSTAGGKVVTGRVTSLAVSNDGKRVYAGTANGGVWRSDNAGLSWRATMNGLHMQPGANISDSLAVGAMTIDPDNPDLIFVGSGEAPDDASIGSSSAFFGVGPLRSDDGGYSWNMESVNGLDLINGGSAFYSMAMDPLDPDLVFAGTSKGLFVRTARNHNVANPQKTPACFWPLRAVTRSTSSPVWPRSASASPTPSPESRTPTTTKRGARWAC